MRTFKRSRNTAFAKKLRTASNPTSLSKTKAPVRASGRNPLPSPSTTSSEPLNQPSGSGHKLLLISHGMKHRVYFRIIPQETKTNSYLFRLNQILQQLCANLSKKFPKTGSPAIVSVTRGRPVITNFSYPSMRVYIRSPSMNIVEYICRSN